MARKRAKRSPWDEPGCIPTEIGSFMDLNRLIKEFGTTEYGPAAGFILSDGTLVDLSGANQGGDPGVRSRDHREVVCRSDDQVSGARSRVMMDFCAYHQIIRLGIYLPNQGHVQMFAPPTGSQIRTLEGIQRDFRELQWEVEANVKKNGYWEQDFSHTVEPWDSLGQYLRGLQGERENPFEQPEPPDELYDPEQLAAGIEVELEHTTDRRIAKRIAKDHLDENKSYYRKLATLGLNPPGWTRGQRQLIEDALAAGLLVQEDAGRVMILTGRSRNAVGLVLDETGVAFRTDVPLKIATAIRTLKEMRRVLGLPGGR